MTHVFGPVPSRRLGRSLGVDLVPFKTCTYNCVYCQLGRTTDLRTRRDSWVSHDEIIAELQEKLETKPEYITLSGSGEPTLATSLGSLIDRIRTITSIPVAVLTNGSLLFRKEVREELMDAHLVIPSLDAGSMHVYEAVNRPHGELPFGSLMEGLVRFREEFRGQYWLEVMVLKGYTANPDEFARIVSCIERIGPDCVQLNTAIRPTAENQNMRVSASALSEYAGQCPCRVEVIADSHKEDCLDSQAASREAVLALLSRRPCTIEDIASGLGIHVNEAVKYVTALVEETSIKAESISGRQYYSLRRTNHSE